MTQIRLSKYLKDKGLCSRREADRLIERGLVYVNGKVIDQLGSKVDPTKDTITLNRRAQEELSERKTVILNKPVGYVSAQPESGYQPAVSLLTENRFMGEKSEIKGLNKNWRNTLAPVGRLDIDSRGLLVLTEEGNIAAKIIGPNADMEKEYIVKAKEDISDAQVSKLSSGQMELDGKQLQKIRIERLHSSLLKMVLVEGKKRQIRRMLEQLGLTVIFLKRVRIGPIELSDLPEGKWRFLTNIELDRIRDGET